jgi:hypothetical protein
MQEEIKIEREYPEIKQNFKTISLVLDEIEQTILKIIIREHRAMKINEIRNYCILEKFTKVYSQQETFTKEKKELNRYGETVYDQVEVGQFLNRAGEQPTTRQVKTMEEKLREDDITVPGYRKIRKKIGILKSWGMITKRSDDEGKYTINLRFYVKYEDELKNFAE